MPRGSVTVDHALCKRCGICVALCPVQNLAFEDGLVTPADKCTGCMLCELHCPDFAIRVTREPQPAKQRGE